MAGGVDPSAGTRGKCSIFADWVCPSHRRGTQVTGGRVQGGVGFFAV